MKTIENKISGKELEFISNITFDNSLREKGYTSSKLPKINAMLAKADIDKLLALPTEEEKKAHQAFLKKCM